MTFRSIAMTLAGLLLHVAAQAGLDDTPRHDEWVKVAGADRAIVTYVVYPEVDHDVMAVVLIHENRGLTDWVRSLADRLAGKGFIVVAPDLLSGMAPGGGGTSEFASSDDARKALYELDRAKVIEDLRAVINHAREIPAADGSVAVAGFCWGGARTWDVANAVPGLAASFVFYGTGPDEEDGVANIDAPVYGFYGGNDQRVNATIPRTMELMKAAGKPFEETTWEGAGHAFMRAGEAEDASEANRKAADEAGERWLALLTAAASK